MPKAEHPFLKVIGQMDLDLIARRNAETVVACDPAEDRARQEFLADTDVNNVVNRYGENFHAMSQPPRDIDYDLDLTTAHAAVAQSRDAWYALPKRVRDEFRNWDELGKASLDGRLSAFLKPPAEAGGSPSDSAAAEVAKS